MMRSLVRAGGAGIAAFLLCSSGNGAPQELRRTLVIFADVSGSIQPDQFKKIKDRVREIVTSHDLRTQIEIYPLDANANSPAESLITPGLAYTTSAMELAGLDAFLETLEKSRTPGSVKERQSCILNSLQHARDRVLNLLEDHRAIELIYQRHAGGLRQQRHEDRNSFFFQSLAARSE